MKFVAIFILMNLGSLSWAIDRNDNITSISKNSKFVVKSDLTILANIKKIEVAFSNVDNVFQTCTLFVVPSQAERIIKTGSVLNVEYVETVKSGFIYPDGQAAVIYFQQPDINALKCFSGDPMSDRHRVPKLYEMEKVLERSFLFVSSSATEIVVENICK